MIPKWTPPSAARARHHLQPNVRDYHGPLTRNAPVPAGSRSRTSSFSKQRWFVLGKYCLFVRNFTDKTIQSPHVRNAQKLDVKSRDNQKPTHYLWAANQKNRRDFKSHNFLCQQKNRKRIVDCFPAQERRDRTCQRAFHQPFSPLISPWTKLLAASCNTAYCADFLLWRVWIVKSLDIPFSNLPDHPFWKFFAAAIPNPRVEYFHRLKFFTNEMNLPTERVGSSTIPATLLSRVTDDQILCFISQSESCVLPPLIPKTNAHDGITGPICALQRIIENAPPERKLCLHLRSSGSHCLLTLHDTRFVREKNLLCGLDVLYVSEKW